MKKFTLFIIASFAILFSSISFANQKTTSKKPRKPPVTTTKPDTNTTNKNSTTSKRPIVTALTPSQEVKELFDASNGRKSITINGRELQQLPNSQGLSRVFSGANDNEVKDFFSKLTGKSLPNPMTISNKGIVYSVTATDGKKYNLRDFASSSNVTGSAWTIDIPKGVGNPTKATEIKFIR